MNFNNIKPIDGVLGNTTITSAAIDASYMFKISGVVKSTHSSANGSIQFQVSNDPPTPIAPTNFVNLGSSVSVNGAGQFIMPQQDVAYRWARAVYTDNTGGTATALITLAFFSFTF